MSAGMLRLVQRAALTSALPLLLLLALSLSALDFGKYWDDEAMFQKVQLAMVSPPTLLPSAYDYPSVTFWISLAGLAPEGLREPKLLYRIPDTSNLIAFTKTETYRLRMRGIFAAISSLTVVWVAGLSLVAGARRWEAFLAAMLVAASWEVNYQIRWIAPDGITMQFTALAVMAAAAALQTAPTASRRWLGAAAAATGLGTSTKYSVWPLVIPLAIAAWHTTPAPATARRRAVRAVKYMAASVAVYFVISPGTYLQPTLAFGEIRGQIHAYARGHGIYTVKPGIDHMWRMLAYDVAVMPSPYMIVAVGWTVSAIAGAYALWRRSPWVAAVILSFPLWYTIYFSLQGALVVRNLLVIAPFGAVLAAHGVGWAWEAAAGRHQRSLHAVVLAAAAIAIAGNILFAIRAVESIRHRSGARTVQEFAAWLDQQPGGSVAVSPRLQADLASAGRRKPPPATSSEPDIAMYALEPAHVGIRPNDPQLFKAVFGPREVNLNYYSDWIGDEHIVVLTSAQAARFGISAKGPISSAAQPIPSRDREGCGRNTHPSSPRRRRTGDG
jgi:hypothetical protein